MIQSVASVGLPVDETLRIQKHRIVPKSGFNSKLKRISIVTGTHGDELEGQYVCYEVIKKIHENINLLNGTVDVYPALNPLGIDCITRGIPGFDLDMNRIFPGNKEGSMAEYVASNIIADIKGSDICIDIHASNIFLKEIPQVRISEITKDALFQFAKYINIDFIWVHSAATVLESTLAHSLNSIGTPTLVVEMGVGMRITKEYGDRLVDGIFNLMREMGIWRGETKQPVEPMVSENNEVEFINAAAPGIFIPAVEHSYTAEKGEHIGDIINPLTGTVNEYIKSPCAGLIFTLREYPVVNEGSLIARILPSYA